MNTLIDNCMMVWLGSIYKVLWKLSRGGYHLPEEIMECYTKEVTSELNPDKKQDFFQVQKSIFKQREHDEQ